jgi:glucosamine-6-phosphate deaminase
MRAHGGRVPAARRSGRACVVIITVQPDVRSLGSAAAAQAAAAIERAVAARGRARVIAATGASQFAFLEALTAMRHLPWVGVALFHLDEYVGLPDTHPASFRRYLRERLIEPTGIREFHALDGMADPDAVCREVGAQLAAAPVDVAFVGIGENGHLAFNDPPADFETTAPYLVVALDEACRRQQVGEGWFPELAAVPTRAISMSCQQILQALEIVCVVPDERKAAAVRATCEDPISPRVPASILRTHPNVTLYLDPSSSALLSPSTRAGELPVEERRA